jgi:shikimate kinase
MVVVIVLMGVSGSGKTTVRRVLAEKLGLRRG